MNVHGLAKYLNTKCGLGIYSKTRDGRQRPANNPQFGNPKLQLSMAQYYQQLVKFFKTIVEDKDVKDV